MQTLNLGADRFDRNYTSAFEFCIIFDIIVIDVVYDAGCRSVEIPAMLLMHVHVVHCASRR